MCEPLRPRALSLRPRTNPALRGAHPFKRSRGAGKDPAGPRQPNVPRTRGKGRASASWGLSRLSADRGASCRGRRWRGRGRAGGGRSAGRGGGRAPAQGAGQCGWGSSPASVASQGRPRRTQKWAPGAGRRRCPGAGAVSAAATPGTRCPDGQPGSHRLPPLPAVPGKNLPSFLMPRWKPIEMQKLCRKYFGFSSRGTKKKVFIKAGLDEYGCDKFVYKHHCPRPKTILHFCKIQSVVNNHYKSNNNPKREQRNFIIST